MSSRSNITSESENIKKGKDHQQMKVSADYRTEQCGYNSGDRTQDWLEIKAEIDNLLQNSKDAAVLLQKGREVSDYWAKVRAQRRNR